MTLRLTHGRALALMVVNAALWSMAGLVTRQLESAQSFEITFWRSLFTVLSLSLLLPLTQGWAVFRMLDLRQPLLWLAGLSWASMFTAFMLALTMTSVANVLITMSLSPLFTALIARFALGYRIPARTALAILLAGAGIAWMFSADVSSVDSLGIWVAGVVPLAAGVNWTLTQKMQSQAQSINLMPGIWMGAVLSCGVTLPLAWPLQAPAHDVAWLAGLGLFQLAIPCLLSVWCGKILKAPEMALLSLLEVVFGIFLAWVGAGEAPSHDVLWGGGLVLLALLVNEGLGWHQRHQQAPT